jgi:hypothetical protein
MNSPEKAELSWCAFRYIADEMSADEQARFEEQLAVDQQAREAVALAVELAHGLAAVPERPAVVAPSRRKRRLRVRLAWSAAAAIAVCFAFALGWQLGGPEEQGLVPGPLAERGLPADDQSVSDPGVAAELVSLWVQADAADAQQFSASANGRRELMAVASPEIGADGPAESSLEVPGWMWAAVMSDLPPASDQPADWEEN